MEKYVRYLYSLYQVEAINIHCAPVLITVIDLPCAAKEKVETRPDVVRIFCVPLGTTVTAFALASVFTMITYVPGHFVASGSVDVIAAPEASSLHN